MYEDELLLITNDLLNKGFTVSSRVVVVVEDEPLDLHEKVVIFSSEYLTIFQSEKLNWFTVSSLPRST